MRKLSLYIIIGIFLIGLTFVSAETEKVKVNTTTILQYTCTLNNAIPSDSTTFNITITDRDGGYLVNNSQATPQGQGSFFYETTFPKIETYKVQMFCTDGSYSYSNEGYYEITPLGGELTQAKATTYIIVFIVGLLIFLGLLLMGIYLPAENKRNEMTGYIFAINNLKYLKLVCLALAYLVTLVIFYFAYTLSYSYLDFNFLTNLFRFIFYFEAIATLPLFALFMYITIANLVRDSKIKDLLLRGLRVK